MSAADHVARLAAALGQRKDEWFNKYTGLGTLADRGVHTQFARDAWLTEDALSSLFYGDPICKRIVQAYPKGALRRGWRGGPRLVELRARERILEAAIWGRLYGGAIVVIGADDGLDMSEPLLCGEQTDVCWLQVYDKREVRREALFADPSSNDWGSGAIFRVVPADGSREFYVHRSRCLVFGGDITARSEKRGRDGWDVSVLQSIYVTIRDFANGHLALGNMLSDASQGVLKMRGLVALITGEQEEVLRKRLSLIDLSRSVARSIFLDAEGDESYEKVASSFSGVPESIDRLWNLLSAVTEIPVTVLAGQAPAGLNASGDSDIRSWYDALESYRDHEIAPQVAKLAALVGEEVSWPSLWQETEKERADRAKVEADTDAVYLANQVVTPEDVHARIARRYPSAVAPTGPRAAFSPAVQAFAERMTELQQERCEHGKSGRCYACGIERKRGITMGPGGPEFGIAWQPIGR